MNHIFIIHGIEETIERNTVVVIEIVYFCLTELKIKNPIKAYSPKVNRDDIQNSKDGVLYDNNI